MKKEIDLTEVKKMIENAEQIVSLVKDPHLKPVAFGKVLDLLFHGQEIFTAIKGVEKLPPELKTKEIKSVQKDGPKAWLNELIGEDFFKRPKNSKEILSALKERGHHLKHSDLTSPLLKFTKGKRLRRKKQTLEEGEKQVWSYSNW